MSLLRRRTSTTITKKLVHGEISPQYISPMLNKVNFNQRIQMTNNDTIFKIPKTKRKTNTLSISKIALLFFTTMFLTLSSVSAESKQTETSYSVNTCEQIIIQLVNLTSIIKEYSSLQTSSIIGNESKLYYIYEKPKFHEQITLKIIDLIFVTLIILVEITYCSTYKKA